MLAQLVEDVRGRGDRVAAEEELQPGQPGTGDQPVRHRRVPVDLTVLAGRHRRRGDLEPDREALGGLTVRVASLEGRPVRVPDLGPGVEPALQKGLGGLDRAVVHPGQQPEREHVLGPGGVLAAQAVLLHCGHGQAGQVDREEPVAVEGAVGQRVRLVAGLGQVALGEVSGVDDQHPAAGHVGQVGPQRGRVHRHQHLGRVTRGGDVEAGEVQLKARHPRQGPRWGPDLGREVRQGRDVVAEDGGVGGEPVPGQLHPVA